MVCFFIIRSVLVGIAAIVSLSNALPLQEAAPTAQAPPKTASNSVAGNNANAVVPAAPIDTKDQQSSGSAAGKADSSAPLGDELNVEKEDLQDLARFAGFLQSLNDVNVAQQEAEENDDDEPQHSGRLTQLEPLSYDGQDLDEPDTSADWAPEPEEPKDKIEILPSNLHPPMEILPARERRYRRILPSMSYRNLYRPRYYRYYRSYA